MIESDYKKLLSKLEKNLIKFSFFIASISLFIVFFILYEAQEGRRTTYLHQLDTDIQKRVESSIQSTIKKYSLTLNRVLSDVETIKLFENKDRLKLYLKVEDDWNFIVQENPHVKVMHFHNADGTSFLRMHKSDKYGDKIALDRPMIREIHQYKKELFGIEVGVYATVLRVIKPIFYQSKYIGSLEIGIDPKYIIDFVNDILSEKGFLFIEKSKIKLFAPFSSVTISNMLSKNIYIEKDLSILKQIPKNYDFKAPMTLNFDGETYHFTSVDMKDYNNNDYGKLLFIKNISSFEKTQKEYIQKIFIIVFSFMIVLFFIGKKYLNFFEKNINAFFSRLLHEEVDKKNYLQTIENLSSSFIVTTNGENILSINKTALDFFSYASIEEFKKEYKCICDLFVKEEGFLQKDMDGVTWTDYIFYHKELIHKVAFKIAGNLYIYIVNVEKFNYEKQERYVATFSNITDLENLNKKFQYIIQRNLFAEEGANIGLWDWDLTNDIVFYSKIWKQLLGYNDDEISQELYEWYNRIHPDDKEKVIQDLDEHFAGKTPYFVNRHRLMHKNKSYIHVSCRAKAIYDENHLPIRMVGLYTDITEQQISYQKIKEQEELMIAQSRHAAMGEMISMIAHQWRQPIANIAMGANNIILDIELDSLEIQEAKLECEGILEQTKYLSNTIDDFRNFFKEEKNKVSTDIEQVIENSINLMEKSLENNDITIERIFFKTEKIDTLPREILQILLNIIKNAKEILVEKEIENKVIKIYTSEDDVYLYIDIEDNAGGVPKENLNKIFQPYFTTKDEHNGTGLGLYMSKTMAQKHLGG